MPTTPSMASPDLPASGVVSIFNQLFSESENTRLVGGADEPYYQPASPRDPATIYFRYDYLRSALHEVAHWCVAGETRRQIPDYGYWYSSDQRDLATQRCFFTVEVAPQALESVFCDALGVPFSISVDNLSIEIPEQELIEFERRIQSKRSQWQGHGLPERARLFAAALGQAR